MHAIMLALFLSSLPSLRAFHKAALHDPRDTSKAHPLDSNVNRAIIVCIGNKQCCRLWLRSCCRTAARLSAQVRSQAA